MIEHKPWKGTLYDEGLSGQRIAIVGNSHYTTDESDHDQLTREILHRVVNGDTASPFFTQIMEYFGYDSPQLFWNRVLFFNYLPESVGSPSDRYALGSKDQVKRAKARLLQIVAECKPQKLFAFTNSSGKGWQTFPNTDEENAGGDTQPLPGFEKHGFRFGTYSANGHHAMAFGLRHPQGAPGEVMRNAVQYCLALPPK